MPQKQKEKLLLKDLCSRLPYGVKVNTFKGKGHVCDINLTIFGTEIGVNINPAVRDIFSISDVKPYLFPLSSMPEKEKNFIKWKLTTSHKHDSLNEDTLEDLFNNNLQVVNYCYEHHIDINGLIEKGLAIDVTGLNVYND